MKKLLIADDNQFIIKSLVRGLSKHFEISTANNAKEAITLIPDMDMILTDWEMPGGNGDEVVDACKAQNKPVIVCSSMPPENLDVPILYKPSDIDTILTALQNLVA